MRECLLEEVFSSVCIAFNGLEMGCFSKAKAWEQSNQSSPGTCIKHFPFGLKLKGLAVEIKSGIGVGGVDL